MRAEHSPARQDLKILDRDEANSIVKYNPLLHWTTQQVNDFIKEHNVPYNVLFDKGFLSISCAPCTRAMVAGKDMRAGRWWWEDASKKRSVGCMLGREVNNSVVSGHWDLGIGH